MSRRNNNSGPDTLLLIVAVLVAIGVAGAPMALAIKLQLTAMAIILAPILGTAMIVVLGILVIKMYWSRY